MRYLQELAVGQSHVRNNDDSDNDDNDDDWADWDDDDLHANDWEEE